MPKITLPSGIVVECTPSELQETLAALAGIPAKRGPGRPPSNGASDVATPAGPKARKPVSAQTAKNRELQGAYLGLVRQLNQKQKATVRAMIATDGKEAAIAEARRLVDAKA